MIEITQKQDLLFQSYFTLTLLMELKNNSFLDSSYYKDMNFSAPWIKSELQKIGIDNQGCAIMALYAMLVIPHEVIQDAYKAEYDQINNFLQNNAQKTTTDYRSDRSSVNYMRHIRNAVAHARIEFRPNDVIIFKDENSRKETFYTELPLQHLGQLIHQLQMVHIKYLGDLGQGNAI